MQNHELPGHLLKSLKEREQKGLLRKLNKQFPAIDFCSNDYLGFAKDFELRSQNFELQTSNFKLSSGSTGSRLITGNSEQAEELEKHIALFHHGESALLFNSGYDANLGLFSSVPQKNDLILYDEFIHASIHDGIRLSYASRFKFKHNSIEDLTSLIQRHRPDHENIYIAVESVYSMDGDTAPLLELAEICKKNEHVYLIVDEAHAIGVFGRQGRGLCNALNIEKKCFARLYTYGKAVGCHGAAIVGENLLRDYLINFARSFIYTTALPPHSLQSISEAYKLLIETNQQDVLQKNIAYFFSKTKELQALIKSQSAIHCYVTGSNEKAEELENLLIKNNIHAKAIKSPTVKEGSERVRFCLHAFNTEAEMDQLIGIIKNF